jgi:hypothetical protein
VDKEATGERENVTPPTQSASEQPRTDCKPPVRFAPDEQFRKAQAKTHKTHAGLFRRLAQ